jgi:P4 family phage/plasmid primase-like protien
MSPSSEKFNNKNNLNLIDFMKEYRIIPGEKYKPTHTSLMCDSHHFGSYHIPSDMNHTLYNLIDLHVFEKKKDLSLTELHEGFKYGPLIDDIDTRDLYEDNPCLERKYSNNDIENYCIYLVSSLEKYCKLSDKQREVYVFQKSKPVLDKKSGMVKDGWHIMMPYLVAPYELFYLARGNRVMNTGVRELFENIGYTNDIDDIIDKCVIDQNGWFMYGASKPRKEPYKLTKIYKVKNGVATEFSKKNLIAKTNRDFIELFSVRNKEINVNYKDDVNIKHIYSKLPDVYRSNKHVTANKRENHRVDRKRRNNIIKNKTSFDIKIVRKYVECLAPIRAYNYDNWIRVGWCLHNIDYSLLDSWIEFSKKASSKFTPGVCEDEWDRMKNEGLGIGTLRMWARKDNSKMYEQIKQEDVEAVLESCLNKGHTNISTYIHAKYRDEFICADANSGDWYQFIGHRWKRIQNGWALRDRIANEIGFDFQDYAAKCYEKMIASRAGRQMNEQQMTTVHQTYHKKFSELANRIGDTAMLNNIMNECKFRFYDEEFYNKLDENDSLIHFVNGVYDLDKDEFREGYPEDYISLSTNVEYRDSEDHDEYDQKILDQVFTFLSQVLPDEDVREYALTLMGSFLSGKNKEQKFYIWTGSGSNGKSMTIDLFQDCLGDYAGTISVSIFTKGRLDANAPSPAVAKLKGKRFVSLQEPENDDKLHMGVIKQWVGGDVVQGRELNKAPIEFVMKAKFVLVCNDLPTIDALDGGTWRRIRLLEYGSKFIDNPNPKKKNEFKIDRSLKEKMTEWHEMFIWLLLQYHRKYKRDGIREPPAVTRVTDEYKENSDFYSQFFNEHMEKEFNTKISVKETYNHFKTWHRTTYEGKKLVLKQNFEKHMSVLMGKPKGNYWFGYQYVDGDDPEDEELLIKDDNDNNNKNREGKLYTEEVDEDNLSSNELEYDVISDADIKDDDNNVIDEDDELISFKKPKNKKSKSKKVDNKKKTNKDIINELSKSTKYIKKGGKKRKVIIIEDSDSDSDSDSSDEE